MKRKLFNLANRILRPSGVQIYTGKGREYSADSAALSESLSNAVRIGRNAALETFVAYLKVSQKKSSSTVWGNTFDFLLEHLTQDEPLGALARTVANVSDDLDKPVDQFIRFYADHYHMGRSQWAQDIFVMYSTGSLTGGNYLEIGGADGVTHSNTLSLRDCLNWRGTLLEPHPEQFKRLQFSRGASDSVLNLAVAAGDSPTKATLIDAGQLSAIQEMAGLDIHSETRSLASNFFEVNCEPFHAIVRNAGPLHYLSLDVEGAEYELLKSLRWGELSPPKCVTVEHNWRLGDIEKIRDLMHCVGYIEPFADSPWLTRGDLWFMYPNEDIRDCNHVAVDS
jgi:FkbM family methyltransferase